MWGRAARLAGTGLLLLAAAGCQRQAPQGAEAAARAADQPKPILAAVVPQAAPAPDPQDFVARAAAANAFEIAAAEVAEARAQNAAVKQFAAMMGHDHAESADELAAALRDAGQSLTPGGSPRPEQQAALDALRSVDPKGFDKAYMDGQVQAHQTTLALLQGYAQDGETVSLKVFAGKAASVVQHHLTLARSLDEQLP
jgi:putative membrane protein